MLPSPIPSAKSFKAVVDAFSPLPPWALLRVVIVEITIPGAPAAAEIEPRLVRVVILP